MKHIILEIITRQKHIAYKDIEYIALPTIHGEAGILPNHAHSVFALEHGALTYTKNGVTTRCVVHQGFATVTENTVKIVTEQLEL